MRRVEVYEYKQILNVTPSGRIVRRSGIILSGTALFHQWGVDYEEFETNAGNFSTAIIERDNGTIENIPANLIKFINKPVISLPRFLNAIGEPVRSTFNDDTSNDNTY